MRVLHGPFPFDPAVPQASARAALAAWAAASREGRSLPEVPPHRPPGLYLVAEIGDGPARLGGFWIVVGTWYLQVGPPGAPERAPPYAGALLEAATEAVWWRELAVAPRSGRAWRPLIVVEWPPVLAARAASPPPGVVAGQGAVDEAPDEGGRWLLPGGTAAPSPRATRVAVQESADPAPGLPAVRTSGREQDARRGGASRSLRGAGDVLGESGAFAEDVRRSLVCVVRAHLAYDAAAHEGRFALVGPERFVAAGATGTPAPFDRWVDVDAEPGLSVAPTDGAGADRHTLGPPLLLPGGGVGWPLSGWLTRGLELWPARPADVSPGALVRRDVRSARATQARLALSLTALVLVPALTLALLVRTISEPNVAHAVVRAPPAPQPAISVCSADHQKFVEELRCQVGQLADGVHPETPVCGDEGAAPAPPPRDDLQPEVCGVIDRLRDGRTLTFRRNGASVSVDAAELAATQACFNVLGHPEPYEMPRAPGDGPRRLALPSAFLDDPALAIRTVGALVTDLATICDGYRGRMEARVEGAVFATHLGLPAPRDGVLEPHALREVLLAGAVQDESARDARCFRAGVEGALAASTWTEVCGDVPEQPAVASEIWRRLGPPEGSGAPRQGDLVERYVRARFGAGGAEPQTAELWRCHLDLARAVNATRAPATWDLEVAVPHVYDVNAGAVRAQLELDAFLPVLRAGGTAGACWGLVAERLSRYVPVHPLLGEVDDDSPWSVEQQVCGQACAARYGVGAAPAGWITPREDMRMCVDTSRPPEAFAAGRGVGALDRLVLPWFGGDTAAESGTRAPGLADVCAFNLIAQDLLPSGEEGLLVSGIQPVAWAGEIASGSRIAGGIEGAAATSARNLSSYGQSRSRETCANVAAQCFVSVLLEVAERDGIERYQWPSAWSAAVERIPQGGRSGNAGRASPWCRLVAPHLSPSGTLPDGQFDYPCAKGVEEQRQRVGEAVQRIARGDRLVQGGAP